VTAFADNFAGTAAGAVNGRVSSSGHVWNDYNDRLRLNGSGQMIRNPAGVSGQGSYGEITLDAPVTSMSANVSWTGTSDVLQQNGSLILIYGPSDVHNGTPPAETIFRDAVHVAFGPWATEVTVYTGGVLQSLPTWFFQYPGGRLAIDGTVYPIGIERRSRILSVIRPDGVTTRIADPIIESYAGVYLIYQCYNTTAPDLVPRFESVAATTAALAGYVTPTPIPARLEPEVDR